MGVDPCMNKTLFSLVLGIVIGSVCSYFLLDYQSQTIEFINHNGEKSKIVHELDFNFISNTVAFMIGASLIVYFTISWLEKKNKR